MEVSKEKNVNEAKPKEGENLTHRWVPSPIHLSLTLKHESVENVLKENEDEANANSTIRRLTADGKIDDATRFQAS